LALCGIVGAPFRQHDRGYFLLFAPLLALSMLWLATRPLTYSGLVIGVIAAMVLTRFIVAACQGLMALFAQEHAMSGRLATVWQFTTFTAALSSAATSGLVAQHASPRAIYGVIGVAATATALYAIWKPKAVYAHTYAAPLARGSDLIGDLRRLFRHRAIYPAMAVMLMFRFSPGQGIVLQSTSWIACTRPMPSTATGMRPFWPGSCRCFSCTAIFCQRLRFGRLLTMSALITIPQVIPLAFIHSPMGAVALAVPIGMMGGLMWAAINDLAMRSCPRGLHGTLMMFVSGMNALGVRGGDLIGTRTLCLGGEDGFRWCVATTLMYVLVLGVIRCVPEHVTATADGEVWGAECGEGGHC
jgi:hypothetical protein